MLQDFPEPFRTDKIQQLLDETIELQDEVDLLIADIDDAVQHKQFEGLLPNVERLLELQPGRTKTRELHADLTGYGPRTRFRGSRSLAGKRYQEGPWGLFSPRLLVILGLTLVGIVGLVYFGVTIYVKTGKGTIQITLHDDKVRLSLDGESIKIENLGKPITVRATAHELIVERDGFETKTKRFTLKRGETLAVEVAVVAGKLAILTGGEKPPPGKSIANTKPPVKPASGGSNPPGRSTPGSGNPTVATPGSPTDILTSDKWKWTTPVNLGPVINSNQFEAGATLSADGLTLIYGSGRPGGMGKVDLWMSKRPRADAPWGKPVNLGPNVNSSGWEREPSLSADGLTLFFGALRSSDLAGFWDLWMSRRSSTDAPWGEVVNLGPNVNSKEWEGDPALSADGLTLVFVSGPTKPRLHLQLWMCSRPRIDAPWGQRVKLGSGINDNGDSRWPALSADGRTLIFRSSRPGGSSGADLWMSRRVLTNPAAG